MGTAWRDIYVFTAERQIRGGEGKERAKRGFDFGNHRISQDGGESAEETRRILEFVMREEETKEGGEIEAGVSKRWEKKALGVRTGKRMARFICFYYIYERVEKYFFMVRLNGLREDFSAIYFSRV